MNPLATPSSMTSTLKLFTFCFYIGKNTYQELVLMLYVLLASLDRFHPDFFLVVYHNLLWLQFCWLCIGGGGLRAEVWG